jgi:hypothetical protein
VAANQDFRPLGRAKNAVIPEWVNGIGNRWKRITEILSTLFGPCESTEIKHEGKWPMDCEGNEALKNLTPEAPVEEESTFSPGEPFHGPPFQLPVVE